MKSLRRPSPKRNLTRLASGELALMMSLGVMDAGAQSGGDAQGRAMALIESNPNN